MRIGREVLGMGLFAVLVFVACRPRPVPIITVQGLPSSPSATPECPHHWEFKRSGSGPVLSDGITDVPEFHDCQRLRGRDERYGPLAAVFARRHLESIPDSAFAAPRGVAVAFVYLPQATDENFPTTYTPLGLTSPFACVIIRRAPRADEAWIVPVSDAGTCWSTAAFEATSSASPLDLHVLAAPEGPRMEIPPVARWDWDERTRTQYIGVRCGSAWCEIGVSDFRSSPGHDPGDGAGALRPGYALRGAYDEQRLAEFDAGTLRSGRNLGTVVPLPALTRLAGTMPELGEWVEAARVHLGPAAGTYTDKFNFAVAPVGPGESRASTVSLCRGTAAVPCKQLTPIASLDVSGCTADEAGARWVARVDRPGAGRRYFCVVYRAHKEPGFSIPPVVRWRWRADDETIWISCPDGCCEVNADL